MPSPAAPSLPFLDEEGPIVYAHRGGGAEFPENSFAAFAHAVGQGFRYLETDARLSADGVLVALHDDHLDRVSDGRGLVSEHRAADIVRFRLRDAQGELTDERIPLLEDLLGRWPQARWNLDAKDASTVVPLGDLIERLGIVRSCCVGAFSDERLDRLRDRFGAELCTALGPKEVGRVRVASLGVPVGRLRGRVAQIPVRTPIPWAPRSPIVTVPLVDGWLLRTCRRLGLPVHVWTVNDPDEMVSLLRRGVGGFMTDRPSVAAAALRTHGYWPPQA